MLPALLLIATLANPANWPPVLAAHVVGLEHGSQDTTGRLVAICERESNCAAIGAHPLDAHLSRRGWRSQVRLGHLDASCQPYQPGAWATRGAWGLSAASHHQFLPPCYHPEALDAPIVSARVAARKLARCRTFARGWCHSRRDGAERRWFAVAAVVRVLAGRFTVHES